MKKFNEGTIYVLEGISQKGKNRINEHGNEWELIQFNELINKYKFQSIKTEYIRWAYAIEDEDFKVV